jgi:hypothetical protein
MRSLWIAVCLFLFAFAAFGQGDRGTITGTITDQQGAVIANAPVQAVNVGSGTVYQAATTATGNYTFAELPFGQYEVSVAVPGFKKYVRQNLTVQVAQTLRVDITLEVGSATEAVTVSAEASMLKTETGDISHNVNSETLQQLPLMGIGAAASGSSGIRNPNNVLNVVPGTYYVPNSQVKVNGAPSNTQTYHVEGQDTTNQGFPYAAAQVQQGVDAIQEVSIQTSNFAAEYGGVGGGFFNVSMRSGTNSIHGSGYDYIVNEVLNAGTPFTGAPFPTRNKPGELVRPAARRHDYGWTVGGPVKIPKLYNGHDRTFFFFNFEQFRETQNVNNIPITVPTDAYRSGDFSAAITAAGNTPVTKDVLGRPVLANQIFDPKSAFRDPMTGSLVANPFNNNTIPMSDLDPVALKIQSFIPHAGAPSLTNNLTPTYPSVRHTTIPAVKIDQQINERQHLSFYWSFTHTDSAFSPIYGASEGLPNEITADRGTFIHSHVERANYDYTISPTVLLHLGAGYQQNNFFDDAPILNFDALSTFGLKGATVKRNVPVFTGFCATGNVCTAAGGMYNMGPGAGQSHQFYEKPSGNASITMVRGNHTYKAGAEVYFLAIPFIPYSNTNGNYVFSAKETNQPYLADQTFPAGTIGFPYASFLLGRVDSYSIAAPAEYRQAKQQWGIFLQDSWKISRRLTLDYGVRWDYGTYFKEEHGRATTFSPTTPNPTLGGYPGAFLFEGNGPGQCHCNFARNYPYAIGPRLGVAYQINDKTVLRAGFGVMFNQTGTNSQGFLAAGVAATATYSSPGSGQPAMILANGIPPQNTPTWPVFSAGLFPSSPAGGQNLPAGIGFLDPNAGRPARQMQWSIGIQREIYKDLAVEASYVGNVGAWWPGESAGSVQPLENINAITPQRLSQFGLDINNPNDQTLLTSQLSSTLAGQRGFNKPPYPGFAMSNTVAQSLRPFPQFGYINAYGAPLGRTWYDSLQMKATKRFSRGLVFISSFTWQKSLQEGVDTNPNTIVGGNNQQAGIIGNPSTAKSISSLDQPLVFNFAGTYTLPHLPGNKIVSWVFRDWEINPYLQYSSGLPIPAPPATTSLANQLFQPTVANRVPGVNLYTHDINCHCFDPATTFILNPAAWANPGPGQFGSGALFYSDYRYARHPIENIGLGRVFRYRERLSFELRVDFSNIFNRTYLNNPTATGFSNPQSTNKVGPLTGLNSGGFGYINLAVSPTTPYAQPRNGTIVLRIRF